MVFYISRLESFLANQNCIMHVKDVRIVSTFNMSKKLVDLVISKNLVLAS